MPPARGAGLPHAPACAKASRGAENARGSPRDLAHDGTWARSQFTSQREDRIEADSAPDGHRASGKGHDHGDGENHRQEHGRNRNLRIEDGMADLMGEGRTNTKS